jgi:hypothetical protein
MAAFVLGPMGELRDDIDQNWIAFARGVRGRKRFAGLGANAVACRRQGLHHQSKGRRRGD